MSYETPAQVNRRLYRPILSGSDFDKIIPKSNCKRIDGGKGNTLYSVSQMTKVVQMYSDQMSKVAQKLKTSSLKSTLQNIQDFAYWHFQYRLDESDQLLRSPACSWFQRNEGIDCKSYSIIVASIFHQLGYKSYFRRASYFKENPYSHVYNVIPKNQTTGDLKDGYFVIDGTLNISVEKEPVPIEKDDLKVNGNPLDHAILAKPARRTAPKRKKRRGLGNSYYAQNQTPQGLGWDSGWLDGVSNFADGFDWGKLFEGNFFKNLWNGIRGIGGQAIREEHFNGVQQRSKEYFGKIIAGINISTRDNNLAKVVELFNDFSMSVSIYDKYRGQYRTNWSNPNSTKVARAMVQVPQMYLNLFEVPFMAWFNNYFTYQTETVTNSVPFPPTSLVNKYLPNNSSFPGLSGGFLGLDHVPAGANGSYTYTRIKPGTLQLKPNAGEVFAFEPTPMVIELSEGNSSSVNIQSLLNTFNTVLRVAGGGSSGSSNNNTGGSNNNNSGSSGNNNSGSQGGSFQPEPAKSGGITGVQMAGGALIAVAGIAMLAPQFKNDKKK